MSFWLLSYLGLKASHSWGLDEGSDVGGLSDVGEFGDRASTPNRRSWKLAADDRFIKGVYSRRPSVELVFLKQIAPP